MTAFALLHGAALGRSRVGVDATFMNADHSRFLSAPDALADVLTSLA